MCMPEPLRLPLLFGALAVAGCALAAPVPGGPVRANTVTQLQQTCPALVDIFRKVPGGQQLRPFRSFCLNERPGVAAW
jgi:hypothetical protein